MTDLPANARFQLRVPSGEDRERLVCADCGFVNYENPKIVVGSVVTWEDRILLCRRAINPRRGFWTLPAGYLELHERAEAGALREAWEEARARIEIEQLLAVYTIERLSQVQLIYRARLLDPAVEAGPESLEVGLFAWDRIPWDQIAFQSVHWALAHHRDLLGQQAFAPRCNPGPADPGPADPGLADPGLADPGLADPGLAGAEPEGPHSAGAGGSGRPLLDGV